MPRIGEIVLSSEEEAILKRNPKFAVLQNLQEHTMKEEMEKAYSLIRMELRDEDTERDEEETTTREDAEKQEEKEKKEKEEAAKTRQVFDPIERTYDERRRRVTDLAECSRVTLPRPLSVIREAEIENRRSLHDKIYQEYRAEKCNDKGEQENNLTWEEKKGLKSLMQRVSKVEILVMKTDKSGKMSVTTRDKYLEMGKEHVGDDEEIGRVKIVETDKVLNEHSAAWCSIWSTGRDHEHQDRVLHSKTSKSENRANLYLMHKDHKKENDKTRPVGTANSSNTRAFANSVSDLLESVAASGDDKFEVISSEDLLHHTKESNRQVKENKALVAEKKQKKDNCWSCKVWKRMCKDCKEQKMRSGRTREEENKETAAENMMRWLLDEVEDIIDGRTHCKECEKEKRKIRERECRKCGDGVSEEENQYALVGMDAVALFPSLSGKTTANIVRKRVFESEVSWEGFNWKKAAIYIIANKHLVGKISRETRKFLPLRKKNQGVTPGMGSKGLSIKEKSEDEQWFYPRKDPGKQVIKEMVSMVAQIGVRVLWENYCYDFGGKTFLQKEGGRLDRDLQWLPQG